MPGKRRQQHELRERDVGLLGQRDRRVERVLPVARQPEDERAEHVDAVLAERAAAASTSSSPARLKPL